MEDIGDLMQKAELKIKQAGEQQQKPLDNAIVELVNQLFAFFYSICRGFEKQYHDPKRLNMEKTQWMKAFQDEKIFTREQVEHGIKQARRVTPIYTPTIGQFLDWCTPTNEALGVPPLDRAYDEACRNSHPSADKIWTHKLVQHAWKLTGSYFLSTSARSSTYPVFQRNYEIAIREWRAGKTIADIEAPIAITKQADPQQSEEIRKKAISDCMAMLKGLSPELSPESVDKNQNLAGKSFDGEEF